jgi:guanine deaminase
VLPRLPRGTEVTTYAHALISAGFVDAHVHYPQLSVIGAGGVPLLDWLEQHTFPAETRHADEAHAREAAERYVVETLRNGITTAACSARCTRIRSTRCSTPRWRATCGSSAARC